MTKSVREEIDRGWRLLNEGKIEETLQLATEFEKRGDLSPEEHLRCKILKGVTLHALGKFEAALEIGNQAIQESISQKFPLLTIEAIYIKWNALLLIERAAEAWEDVKYCEHLLKSPLDGSNSEIEQANALFMYMRGYYHYWAGEYDQALEYHKRVLVLVEKHFRLKYLKPFTLMILGHNCGDKGELDKALEYQKSSLENSLDSNAFIPNSARAISYNSIGTIYRQKGDLELAYKNLEKSMQIFEQLNMTIYVGIVYDNLVSISLERKEMGDAREYLNRFSQYNKKVESRENSGYFKLSRARILKSSTRTRDWAEAEIILKELIEDSQSVTSRDEFTIGLITLCDLYFQELKLTNDLGILEEIQPLVDRLLKEAERTNSFSLRAQAFLLKGKISSLQLNMGDARRNLTEAQNIADSHGLQLLAREISYEHDKLLEQLDKLKGDKKNELSLVERLNMASLDETMDLMQGRREINAPEIANEEPVLLMILTTGGVVIFSHPFTEKWNFDSELFGGFLSTFNSISDEVFAEGIDRVKFGKHTVLMEPVSNFSVCYLYKGQTYQAKKKLSNFTNLIKENDSIELILEKFEKTSQALEVKDFPFLKSLITQIFIKG